MSNARKIASLWGNKLFPFSDSFSVGATLGPRWTGATWSISSGKAINTPATLGDNLVVNGTFAAWTGDNPDNWTVQNEDVNNYVTEATGKARMVSNGSATVSLIQSLTVTAQRWYRYSAVAVATGQFCTIGSSVGTNVGPDAYSASGTIIYTPRSTGTNININISSLGNTDWTFDDISAQLLALSELIASVETKKTNADIQTALTTTIPTRACPVGVIAKLDSAVTPANFLLAYIVRRSQTYGLYLDKYVGGTYTNLLSGNITYGDGKVIRLVTSGTSVSAYYDGAQVGTTQTVSDAGIVNNTRHGIFSVHPSNALDNFSIA